MWFLSTAREKHGAGCGMDTGGGISACPVDLYLATESASFRGRLAPALSCYGHNLAGRHNKVSVSSFGAQRRLKGHAHRRVTDSGRNILDHAEPHSGRCGWVHRRFSILRFRGVLGGLALGLSEYEVSVNN